MLSKFQTTQCEINAQFEVCYCNDLTLTADKHLLNNESEMCVGPTADSPLKFFYVMGKALSGELSCPCDRYGCIIISDHSEYLYNVITCNHDYFAK